MKNSSLFVLSFVVLGLASFAQQTQPKIPTEYGSGLKVNLSEDGSKYFRLMTWGQFWLDMREQKVDGQDKFTATPMVRRLRLAMYAQLTDRFLIFTHIGLNNLTPAGLDPLGYSAQSQIFLHDAWVEYKITNYLYLGGGLHYWNGISRLNSSSTLNFLAVDNPRHAWPTLGTTDQFLRHLGIYAKGQIGRLDYRMAWNGAMVNSFDANNGVLPTQDKAVYTGRKTFGISAKNVFAGYFDYQFWEKENNKLPFFVGSYLGAKKVFNLGAGFYAHPKGTVVLNSAGSNVAQNVLIWSADAFMELPFGEKKSAFTGYLAYQKNDFGKNYQLSLKNADGTLGYSQDVFTGSAVYFQGGILLPHQKELAWQPYFTLTNKKIIAIDKSTTDFGIGCNAFISNHNAKLTLEYRSLHFLSEGNPSTNTYQIILQAAVFL